MTLPKHIDAVVVGAGQAGLTMSWHLRRAGREHVLLDRRDRLGGGWLDRWDAFRLVSPNWTASFPDDRYQGPEPDGFMSRDEIAGRVAAYARRISAPVALGTEVHRLRQRPAGGFRIETSQGAIDAREVIVATGGYHAPRVPACAASLSRRIASLHSHAYRDGWQGEFYSADPVPGAPLLPGANDRAVQRGLRDEGGDCSALFSYDIRYRLITYP